MRILAPPQLPRLPSPICTPPRPSHRQRLSPNVTPPRPCSPHSPASEIGVDVKITRQTTISSLYTYALGTSVEYPQTSIEGVGHLFLMDPSDTDNWPNPIRDFAYSLGDPKGYTRTSLSNFVEILTDSNGNMVPCRIQHATCKGIKICPRVNQLKIREPHSHATRALLQQRFRNDRQARLNGASPSRDVFQKTAALVTALRKLGCSAPRYEETIFESDEEEAHDAFVFHRKRNQRGYVPKQELCEGRLYLRSDFEQKPYIKCEHYSKQNNKNHYLNTSISDGSYDLSYLEALFGGDEEEVLYIEEAAIGLGFGPLVECTTICNTSSQRTLCPFDHRDDNGELIQLEMESLACDCIVKAYVPFPEYRAECPKVLVVVKGVHHHPIPLPHKTPNAIKAEIIRLLPRFQEDLPDLTPRRFLRNPIVKSYLSLKFPNVYIDQVRQAVFPHGTDWKGLSHLYEQQTVERPLKDRYIRCVVDLDANQFSVHPEDEPNLVVSSNRLRFIVCMGWEGSDRLQRCQYVQSDIGFKRVVGFYEFELGGWERDAHTSVVFCRIFLNRQTAVAHQKIIQAIEDIVLEDMGRGLQWRHIHGTHPNDYDGKILQWAGDQHAGQAKGLGLHLQHISQMFPEKMDLHEPHRKLASLTPYDHLHRKFRLCVNHAYRNIQKCRVPDAVKHLMRSLVCMEHSDWDGTIHQIRVLGGKPACDWVADKERSHFAFEGMCWAKSFIPKLVWQAGERTSNLIESVHADVNREGVHCTLLGGVLKGEFYDALQMKTLKASCSSSFKSKLTLRSQAFEGTGIRSSYLTGHPAENAIKNLKRKCMCSPGSNIWLIHQIS
ncbi:hypothetical protein B0H19DRAFT_970076 [Mycena capillaripes]|nr:hypothetical protein B0H19DRAFT_970076 [Mycena capillaripes]